MAVPDWFSCARQVLELVYYLSSVAIAIAAFLGLRQLNITRTIARDNAKREAYKLAADTCQYFASTVVPLETPLRTQIREKKITSFEKPRFVFEQGNFTSHKFDPELLQEEISAISKELITFLNALEAFALFFASGVAAEEIGYRETGTAFCRMVTCMMPALFMMREHGIRFESTFRLYEMWRDRLKAEKIASRMKALESNAIRLSRDTIKPIGT